MSDRPGALPEGENAAEPRLGTRLRPLTVGQLNDAADRLLREALGPAWVAGELSRFVAHRSGHWYFTLKDDAGSVSCAMFRGRNRAVAFEPEDGDEVLVFAVPGVYSPQGRYQLIVDVLEPRGQGAAALALERLKQRLAAEGLFDEARKKPLPLLPDRIGVVTSRDGAALRDLLRVLRRRFAGVEVLLCPAAVQGRDAPAEITRALAALDRRGLDVLLLVRGGGAREDLAAFDDESVVRQLAACVTPVITGVGHEIDTTLADLAADVRAATPSAAAEIVVRERADLSRRTSALRGALLRVCRHRVERARSRLLAARGSRGLGSVQVRVQRANVHVGELARRIERATRRGVQRRRALVAGLARRMAPEGLQRRLAGRRARWRDARTGLDAAVVRSLHDARQRTIRATTRLEAMSPLAVLDRGYALVTLESATGPVVDDASRLQVGDGIHVRFARGSAGARVESTSTRRGPGSSKPSAGRGGRGSAEP